MIHLAIVGCGGMAAGWHAPLVRQIPDCKVIAVCDISAEQARSFRERFFPDAAEYVDLDFLLKHPPDRLDAILLATPHTLHYPQAKAALEHGLHVLVEKPMVTSSEHAYDLWRTAKRAERLLGITFQAPHTPEFIHLAEQRDAGRLGKIQLISGYLAQNWLQFTAGTWRQDPALSGGGQMYDSGAHLLNAFMWLVNEPVIEVACFYDKLGAPVDINGVAIVRFRGGALGSICIGGSCSIFRTEIQIQTDAMLIITDQYGGKLEMAAHGRRIYPHVPPLDSPAAGTPHLNFINAILGREPLRAPARYGVLLAALMDALYESADKHCPVKVEPVPEEI